MKKFKLFMFFFFIAYAGGTFGSDSAVSNILYINSYHSGFTWSDSIESGFIDTLNRKGIRYNIFMERMDSNRFPLKDITPVFLNYLKKKYPVSHFNLVVTSDDNAFNFAMDYRDVLFPEVPVVFSGVNNKDNKYILHPYKTAGVLEDVNIKGLIDLIVKVHPEVENIAVIGDETETAAIHIRNTVEILKSDFPHLIYSVHKDWTLDSLAKELDALPNETVIIELAFHIDADGHIISFEQEKDFLQNHTDLPAYSLWDTRMNYGILGGMMTSGRVHGQVAASLSAEILGGSFPSSPVVDHIPYPVYFDYEQIKRFKIPLIRIPLNAVILNRPDTLWYKYKYYLMVIMFFTAAQAVMIILLAVNISRKRSAQFKLQTLNQDLEHLVEVRTKKLIETEKMASLGVFVSGIMHQLNTPLGICTTAVTHAKRKTDAVSQKTVHDSLSLIDENLKKIGDILSSLKLTSVNLIGETLSEVNLSDLINQIILSQKDIFDEMKIKLDLKLKDGLVISTYTRPLFRVLMVLINNSIIHGFRKELPDKIITIETHENEKNVIIVYRDNGSGITMQDHDKVFDPFYTTRAGAGSSGLGLSIAYNEIVHRLKGTIELNISETSGAEFVITFPETV